MKTRCEFCVLLTSNYKVTELATTGTTYPIYMFSDPMGGWEFSRSRSRRRRW